MSPDAITEFIENAKNVDVGAAAQRLGLKFSGRGEEHAQACPVCGGKDTFAFNVSKNKWNCRRGGIGGQDAIGMAAHVLGIDLNRRDGFLEACSAVSGLAVPDDDGREDEAARAARRSRISAIRRKNDEAAAAREREGGEFRARERQKARGIYEAAAPLFSASDLSGCFYLQGRGLDVPDDEWLRVAPDISYWHGRDELGRMTALHSGPAMVAPFLSTVPGDFGTIIGCHITWIDLARPPKLRPMLADPGTGEILPTKKMRGTKKGGVIPLCGKMQARRWLGAEGIENALAVATVEGFRADSFYFAAGDLGNLSGPADPASRRPHPVLQTADKTGRKRPVMVPGPVPLIRDGSADAMIVPEHVDELWLAGDGDSEPVATAAAMVRAKVRHSRPGRLVTIVMPRPGMDFADMLASGRAA